MCGLAGILKKNGEISPEIEPILRTMGNQIAYRGPDDEQIFINDSFGGVFRRLSIVDVAGGRQPLFNEDGSLMLMVNGEIYNHHDLKSRLKEPHQFRTQSDCEIILHLYEEKGEDFLSDLNGMFALVLWDKKKQRLILARDRLGIKPLYYTESNQRLLFGSEIKALLAYPDCPREFDWVEALSHQHQRMSPDNSLPSFFKDINYLPAGSLLIADVPANNITVKRYWHLTPLSDEEYALDTRTEQEMIAGYGELLADSVKLRLMADVEVGLFLSGGIDSVSVAALASPHQKLHTFSVLSQSTFQNGDARAGHIAAKYLGMPNHQLLYSWHDNPFTPEHWKALLWLCETPLCNAEHLYKYHLHRYAKNLRPALKVILLGQGSDEFNGGYSVDYVKEYRPDLNEIGLLPEIKIDNWEAQADNLALQLAIRREKTELLDQTVALMPGARLLKIDQTSEDSAYSYLSVDDKIEYELPENEMKEWLAVLRRIDGKRSINEILSELNMPASKIRKHLEEALDYEILSFLEE